MTGRVLVATVAAAAIGGGAIAASAIGQGTGGTVGNRATGNLSVQFQLSNSRNASGINPAVPRDKTRPKIMDIMGGHGSLLVDGKRVGRVQGYDVTTYGGPPAKRYRGRAEFVQHHMLDFGNDNLLFAICRASDDPRNNPCGIISGTGDFAGARGTAIAALDEVNRQDRLVNFNITFIP
jgi:hypothetical protein